MTIKYSLRCPKPEMLYTILGQTIKHTPKPPILNLTPEPREQLEVDECKRVFTQ